MPNILDVFNQDAFGVVALTAAVNDITAAYGVLGQLGIFIDEGIPTRAVAVDFDPITNALLPQSNWGGPGVANKTALGKTKSFAIPHFPVNDAVLASDLQSRRRPGSDAVQDAQYALAKKMIEIRTKLDQILEWMRLGVLKGSITDGAGTVILNPYTDFGVAQDSTSFVLATATTDVSGKIAIVKRNIQKNLRGEIATGYVALCSDGFYDAFVSHANVKSAFQYYIVNGQTLAGDYRDGFLFGNVLWINYTGSVADPAGTLQPMIDANSAYVIPRGTSLFKTFFAPADYMETVNTLGQPFYAKQDRMKFDKGVEVECQSNPLPICLKPLVVQKVTVA